MKKYFLILLLSLFLNGCWNNSFIENSDKLIIENNSIEIENVKLSDNSTTINLGYKTEDGGFGKLCIECEERGCGGVGNR